MTPITDRAGCFSPLKAATLAGLMVPPLYLLYRTLTFDLGPLPVKEALLFTGLWAVRFLIVTLALTPAQRIFNWPRLALVRRMVGVSAFGFAALHFSLYVAMVKFDLLFAVSEIALRIYLTIGFATLLGLSALAATSTDGALRRLGPRWKMLHRLIYGIAILAVLHFFLQSKIDVSEAVLMAGLYATLMIYRLAIKRRIALSPAVLAGSAVLGGATTALIEFVWYGLATGVDPWRIAMANLMFEFGIRPAVAVMLAGLGVAAINLVHGLLKRPGILRQLRPA